ncbi:SAF domain-containing protein [Microbacterium luticocti]|uniref:SAF domain-containing protein n=1 Tax=Microbacterium luticocti TaxID=451764 RepID=UPI000683EAAE|nr:SAF domain-containing protein [Microbacterium luticocti]
MSALDNPSGTAGPQRGPTMRRRRGFWTDTRFFIGIALIVASVAGVWAVVALSRQTAPVYAAAHTIVPGQTVTAADLTVVDVALGHSADAYLAPGKAPRGAVATRTVEAGELVPASATVPAAESDLTTVVVRTDADVPTAVRAGAVVELWAAAQTERGVYDTPRVLIPRATVASVTRDDSMIGGGKTALELAIPRADVAGTLAAISAGSALSVVPAGGAR